MVVFEEGQESPEFWHGLGGMVDYQNDAPCCLPTPQFFQLSHFGDGFAAVEIPNFTQQDLEDCGTALIDTGKKV